MPNPINRWKTSNLGVAIVVVITAITALAAALFADSSQAARVANDGAIYTAAQRLGAAVSAVKGNMGLTVVLVSAEQSGVGAAEDVDGAIARVRADLVTVRDRASALDDLTGSDEMIGRTRDAVESVETVLDRLAAAENMSDAKAADELARSGPLPDLEAIESAAATVAREAQARIDAEGSRAGSAARASSLVVALIVPAVAAWSLFSAARRREERLRLKAELDKSMALVRARDELIAGISHQLRTPLTAIMGYARTLMEMPHDPAVLTEGLEVIEGQAAELSRMVDDLVTMARLEDGPVQLRRQIVDVVREIEIVLAGNTAWTSVQTALSPASVWADRLRLRHILTNLISNAMTHGGSSVVVKSAPITGMYRIAVADNGAGVPSSMIDSVFEPYVHSPRDAVVKGTLGLGLAVAKRLAEQMSCELSYQRTNGYTLFVLDVPLASSAQLPQGDEVAAAP